jgi:hypothetical protein
MLRVASNLNKKKTSDSSFVYSMQMLMVSKRFLMLLEELEVLEEDLLTLLLLKQVLILTEELVN